MMQQTTETETDAAQVRVTPGELAQATAIIQARREAEAKHLADTIALGEAVEQLGLATTPEELLSEVQKIRAKAQQSKSRQKRRASATAGFVGGIVAVQVVLAGSFWHYFISLKASISTLRPQATFSVANQTLTANSILPYQRRSTSFLSFNNDMFLSLDHLQEGQTAKCDIKSLEMLGQGVASDHISVWRNSKTALSPWRLHRQSGKFCVQCWVRPADHKRALQGQSVAVRAEKNKEATTAVTISVKRFVNATPIDSIKLVGKLGYLTSAVQLK